jgi:hypothetical protein
VAPGKNLLCADIFNGAATTGKCLVMKNKLDGGRRRYLGLEKSGAFGIGVERLEKMPLEAYGLVQVVKEPGRVGWDYAGAGAGGTERKD